MTIDELAREYEGQYRVLCAKLDGLKPNAVGGSFFGILLYLLLAEKIFKYGFAFSGKTVLIG